MCAEFATGLPHVGASATTHKFTGYERDAESGLDNAQARYNSSSLGRFMSPDPIGNFVADATNPQSWNMYAYVNNSPLTLVDPTGLEGEGGGTGCDPETCPTDPSCGLFECWDPSPEYPPTVTISPAWSAPPMTGLPPGIFATGPGLDWFNIIFGPPNLSQLIINNWTGSACDPSVPNCGATANCPDEGGPCTIRVGGCDPMLDDTCRMDVILGMSGRRADGYFKSAVINMILADMLNAGAELAPVVLPVARSGAIRAVIATDSRVPGGVRNVVDFGKAFMTKNNPAPTSGGMAGAAARDIFDILSSLFH